jgi:hypothetical protein
MNGLIGTNIALLSSVTCNVHRGVVLDEAAGTNVALLGLVTYTSWPVEGET